jgi:hypothetical protein
MVRQGQEELKLAKDALAAAEDAIKKSQGTLNGFDQISHAAAEKIQKNFDSIDTEHLGEKAGKDYIDGLNSATAGLKGEELTTELERLSNVDIQTWDLTDGMNSL